MTEKANYATESEKKGERCQEEWRDRVIGRSLCVELVLCVATEATAVATDHAQNSCLDEP